MTPSPSRVAAYPATIRRGPEFAEVLRGGRRFSGRWMVLYVRPQLDGPRSGFVCGRGVGTAVIRNRARRLLREAWRGLRSGARSGYDVVFVARAGIKGAGMGDVARDMEELLRAAGVISP